MAAELILIVNDEELAQTRQILEEGGYQVETTSTAGWVRLFENLMARPIPDLDAVCRELAGVSRADYCSLWLAVPEGLPQELAGFIRPDARASSFPAGRLAARTLELGRALSLRRSATTDERTVPGIVMGLPILAEGQPAGVLLVSRDDAYRPFEAADRALFELVASQLAGRLLPLNETELPLPASTPEAPALSQETRLRRLIGRFMNEQEQARQTLNGQIQAELLPSLISTRKNIQAFVQRVRPSSAGDLLQAEERLHALINAVKRLTGQLQPTNLTEFGLSAALRQYVRELVEAPTGGCAVSFHLEGEEVPRLENEVELALFRACQESLAFACHRARSGPVSLTVRVSGPRNKPTLAEFIVRDNTPGLDPARLETDQPDLWLKLLSVEERARLAGGEYSFSSDETGSQIILSHALPVLEPVA